MGRFQPVKLMVYFELASTSAAVGQIAPTQSAVLVARITPHSDVEIADAASNRARVIHRHSTLFNKDVAMSPDGRYVAFIEFDPGIEGNINVRPSREVNLSVVDTTGSPTYTIAAGVVRYAWCGNTCIAYLTGSSDESDDGYHVSGAYVVDFGKATTESLPGPPWPYALAFSAHDSSVYLAYPKAGGFEIWKYDLATNRVSLTPHKGFLFSKDGNYYLSYPSSSRDTVKVYQTSNDSPVLTNAGGPTISERWLPSSGSQLLMRRVSTPRPPQTTAPERRFVVRLPPHKPPELDYVVYDLASHSVVQSIHGIFPHWGAPAGVAVFISGDRIRVLHD